MSVGERIKKRREELGMTQEELAKSARYKSRSSINKIEADGRGVPRKKIELIAKVLRTTPEFLMGWSLADIDVQELRPEVIVIAEQILDRPELMYLFNSSLNASTEDIINFANILERISSSGA